MSRFESRGIYIGPVVILTGGNPDESKFVDPFFDPEAGTIRGATNERLWEFRREACIMNAPKAQGSRIAETLVTVTIENPRLTKAVVLDRIRDGNLFSRLPEGNAVGRGRWMDSQRT